jgi:hypothetical protein
MVETTRQRADVSPEATTRPSSLVFFILACLGVLPVLAMPVFQYLSVGGNAEYACITGPVPPNIVTQGATSLVEGHKTVFPAGRYCEWESLSGGALTYQTGWITTIVACVATAFVIWMTVLAIRNHRPRRLFVAIIPALVALLSWVAVFV